MERSELFTVEEVSDICRVSVWTVRRWIKAGAIDAIRLPGGQYRVPVPEVERIKRPIRQEESVA